MPTATLDTPRAGRVALVTGAAHGIGQAIPVGLAERGASAILGDIDDVSAPRSHSSMSLARNSPVASGAISSGGHRIARIIAAGRGPRLGSGLGGLHDERAC